MPLRLFLSAVLFLAALSASARPLGVQGKSLEFRAKAGDIVFSDRARRGARLWIVDKPARHAAGMAVPAGVAQLYSNGNSGQNDNAKGGNGNSDHDGNDHNDDGHTDSGKGNANAPALDDRELVVNHEFAQGLTGWDGRNAYVDTAFGPIKADPGLTNDGIFAVVHNGYWDQSVQGSLSQAIQVPMSRNASFNMLYNFVTTEYPTWQGTEFNDHFKMTLTGPSGDLDLSKAEFLNSGSFTEVRGMPLFGWDYDANDQVIGGQTGWQTFNYPKLPLKSGIYNLRIEVNDVGDDIVDSAILVDRVSLR